MGVRDWIKPYVLSRCACVSELPSNLSVGIIINPINEIISLKNTHTSHIHAKSTAIISNLSRITKVVWIVGIAKVCIPIDTV